MATTNQAKAERICKAILPVFTKSFATLAETIVSKYEQALNTAEAMNKSLSERIEKMHDDHINELAEREQRIAELTDALAHARKGSDDKTSDTVPDGSAVGTTTLPKRKKYGKESVRHYMIDKIIKAVKRNRPVYLAGPAGTGKTQICEMIAEDLNLDFYMSAKVDDKFGIEGYMDAYGKFNMTAFYKAFKNGGLFMFDEIDASDNNAIVAVNAAIANGYYDFPGVGMTYAHKNFRVVACGNTFGIGADDQYTGRTVLDASTLDRFLFFTIDYDERIELACAKGNRDILQFVHDLRRALKKTGINSYTISYRGIINLVECEEMYGNISEALQYSITKGLDSSNVRMLYNNLDFKNNKYATAFCKSASTYANAA